MAHAGIQIGGCIPTFLNFERHESGFGLRLQKTTYKIPKSSEASSVDFLWIQHPSIKGALPQEQSIMTASFLVNVSLPPSFWAQRVDMCTSYWELLMHSGGDLKKLVFDAKKKSDLKKDCSVTFCLQKSLQGIPPFTGRSKWPKLLATEWENNNKNTRKFCFWVYESQPIF